MTKRAAVIGYPIGQSLSPVIHNHWLREKDIEAIYEKIEVRPENLIKFIEDFKKDDDFLGFNITVPHKEAVFEYLLSDDDCEISTIGRIVCAVNTVAKKNGKIIATNTDCFGFAENIKQNAKQFDFTKGTAVVIGAGGAARAVVAALILEKVPQIIIANRTVKKAENIIYDIEQTSGFMHDWQMNSEIKAIGFDEIESHLANANLLVNTTTLGMAGQPPLKLSLKNLSKDALVNDIVYKPLETDLLRDAKQNGNKTVDGLGMLLYQALEGFEMWFGQKAKVTDELRDLVLGR